MEEAHYFVKRYNDDAENTGPTTQCCKVFEKIAREGRKFGLGLVLSSQRPSELSPTVLSQCNSFYCIVYPMTEIRNWLAVCYLII